MKKCSVRRQTAACGGTWGCPRVPHFFTAPYTARTLFCNAPEPFDRLNATPHATPQPLTLESCLSSCFVETNRSLRRVAGLDCDLSGSTGIVAVVTHTSKLVVANLGDSRCVAGECFWFREAGPEIAGSPLIVLLFGSRWVQSRVFFAGAGGGAGLRPKQQHGHRGGGDAHLKAESLEMCGRCVLLVFWWTGVKGMLHAVLDEKGLLKGLPQSA